MEMILFKTAVLILFWLILRQSSTSQQQAALLHKAYRAAIASGDKEQARLCGQAFYAFFRRGKLTLRDEQALEHDLRAMD